MNPADAVLTLDGTAMGSANDFLQDLSAGTHDIEISAAGYQSRRETVTIAAGAEQPMKIALERPPLTPTTGTLVLDVTTPGAVLMLDGKRIGLAKGFRQELPAGVHEVKIEARGYHTATKTLDANRWATYAPAVYAYPQSASVSHCCATAARDPFFSSSPSREANVLPFLLRIESSRAPRPCLAIVQKIRIESSTSPTSLIRNHQLTPARRVRCS